MRLDLRVIEDRADIYGRQLDKISDRPVSVRVLPLPSKLLTDRGAMWQLQCYSVRTAHCGRQYRANHLPVLDEKSTQPRHRPSVALGEKPLKYSSYRLLQLQQSRQT